MYIDNKKEIVRVNFFINNEVMKNVNYATVLLKAYTDEVTFTNSSDSLNRSIRYKESILFCL